ncbi:MAG: DUF447 domain-containing protein [Candidatus Bathyarchaeia archaeon]
MAKLTDLGFLKGMIFEAIVSTYNRDGSPNAAPMGTIMQNQYILSLNVFNSSETSLNLKTNKCAVINFTNNIDVFYRTTFKEANPTGKLPQEWFEKAETVNAPKLQISDATIEVSVASMEPMGAEKTNFSCSIVKINVDKMYPQIYSRAMAMTLEAIIHATRVKAFVNDEKQQKNVKTLLELIENNINVVNRVAPNSMYTTIMTDLTKRIDSWRNKP